MSETQELNEDIPQLSAETFAALQEFYNEQAIRDNKVNNIKYTNTTNDVNFEENWVNLIDILVILFSKLYDYVSAIESILVRR